jgi:hypothetical protein
MYVRTIVSVVALVMLVSTGHSAEPYRIGILLSLTGPAEPLGREAMTGIRGLGKTGRDNRGGREIRSFPGDPRHAPAH